VTEDAHGTVWRISYEGQRDSWQGSPDAAPRPEVGIRITSSNR
jgi:hypothetical protein